MVTKICIFCLILMAIVLPSRCAPRKKSSKTVPQTVYDQTQTGDYNIQLHLKDFQIIALLADDSIGALGDYDYNYDYSDFTVKPITQKPSDLTTPRPAQPPSSPQSPESPPTLKPANHPYPILAPSTPQPPKEDPLLAEKKPANAQDKPNDEPVFNEVDKTEKPATTESNNEKVDSTTTGSKADKNEESNSPGKIKVQIIETPVNAGAIVPGEEIRDQKQDAAPHGEIMQRRCGSGFARDKKGRCRRIRRPGSASPQIPYGISRLASNLASRFRYASPDTSLSSSSSSESTED